MDNWFVIKDLDDFIDATRGLVYNHFGSGSNKDETDTLLFDVNPSEKEEMDSILSHDECMIIAKSKLKRQRNKITKEIRYTVNEEIYVSIIELFNDRMVSNTLNSLVNKGFIESGFDEETNDFIFWVKDDIKKEIEKPETD